MTIILTEVVTKRMRLTNSHGRAMLFPMGWEVKQLGEIVVAMHKDHRPVHMAAAKLDDVLQMDFATDFNNWWELD